MGRRAKDTPRASRAAAGDRGEMYIKELERLEITNNEGAFLIENLTAGTYTIVVFAYEFEIIEQDVTINGNTEFNPVMNPLKVQNLSEVVITQKREEIFALKQLKKVDGTAIYAGKKNEVVLLTIYCKSIKTNVSNNEILQIIQDEF